jgi:hypothetical protein
MDWLTSEVQCGHGDVCVALSSRLELLQGVGSLWREGRGLQAATNCVRGCFSEDVYDTVLFCDVLQCFTSFHPPWTLAVCVVLLPVTAQLLGSQRDPAQLATLAAMVEMVVKRFSSSILACKKSPSRKSHSLSATSDFQQRTTCYAALQKAWVALGDRLEYKEHGSIIISLLSSMRSSLTPFSTELADQTS